MSKPYVELILLLILNNIGFVPRLILLTSSKLMNLLFAELPSNPHGMLELHSHGELIFLFYLFFFFFLIKDLSLE